MSSQLHFYSQKNVGTNQVLYKHLEGNKEINTDQYGFIMIEAHEDNLIASTTRKIALGAVENL